MAFKSLFMAHAHKADSFQHRNGIDSDKLS